MSVITNLQLVASCKEYADFENKNKVHYHDGIWAGEDHLGYVLGGQYQLYSLAMAKDWGRRHKSGKAYNYFVVECAEWFGRRILDCSGMIIQSFREQKASYPDQTANGLHASCSVTGPIHEMPEIVGLQVWKNGHTGVYIGNGWVIECRGHDYGVVVSKLSTQPWKEWGKLRNVSYLSVPVTPPVITPIQTSPYLVNVQDVNVRMLPVVDKGNVDCVYHKGMHVSVISIKGDWAKISLGNGIRYMWADYLSPVQQPVYEFSLGRVLHLPPKGTDYMSGDDVHGVQVALNKRGYALKTDGDYGPISAADIGDFQKKHKLIVDKRCGKQTATVLGGKWTA